MPSKDDFLCLSHHLLECNESKPPMFKKIYTIELFAKYPKPGFKTHGSVKKQVSGKKSPASNIPCTEVGIKLFWAPKSSKFFLTRLCLRGRASRALNRWEGEEVVCRSRLRVAVTENPWARLGEEGLRSRVERGD